MLGLGLRGRFGRVGGRIPCGRLCRLRCGGSRGVRGWRGRGGLVGGRNRRLLRVSHLVRQLSVSGRVTLSDDAGQVSHTSQICHCFMCSVRLRLIQIRPSQKTSRPVPFPRRMVCDEFVKVDWSIGLVECISALCTSVICKSRGY
jgi:hypothetical protein